MTTKEIADATGKTERSIQSWAKNAGKNVLSIIQKIDLVQKTGKPADYDLEETIAIIQIGMGKNAASLYRMNAMNNAVQSTDLVTKSDLALFGKAIVSEVLKQLVKIEPIGIEAAQQIEKKRITMQSIRKNQEIRKNIISLINSYCKRNKRKFDLEMYNLNLKFRECTNIVAPLDARRRPYGEINYIEAIGMLDVLESIAIDYFKY